MRIGDLSPAVLSLRDRRLEPLLYPYIQLLQEAADDVGFFKGWREFRRTRP